MLENSHKCSSFLFDSRPYSLYPTCKEKLRKMLKRCWTPEKVLEITANMVEEEKSSACEPQDIRVMSKEINESLARLGQGHRHSKVRYKTQR